MKTQVRQQDGVTILTPNGRIIGAAVLEFKETLAPQIEDSNTPRILINFENVNRIDSIGLGTLMEARMMATRKQGRIGVIHVGKHIRNVLVLGKIISLFERFDSEDAAIAALSA